MTITNLTSQQAKSIYFSLLDYFIMSDDPKFSVLKKFAGMINRLPHPSDREHLKTYFESEAHEKIDYFK